MNMLIFLLMDGEATRNLLPLCYKLFIGVDLFPLSNSKYGDFSISWIFHH